MNVLPKLSQMYLKKYMNSFPTKTQIINQPLNTPSIPAVAPSKLPRPQRPPNIHNENLAELEEQFANYFFHFVILYLFSFKSHIKPFLVHFQNVSPNVSPNEPTHSFCIRP